MAEISEHADTLRDYDPPETEPPAQAGRRSGKKWLMLAIKLGISAAGLYLVYGQLVGKDGLDELTSRLSTLRWEWFAAAALMQLGAIGFAIARWHVMLGGQGIRAKWSFLVPSFMIGRFWGAFTPGGLGLDGWKLYDVAQQTKKPARAVAVATVEKILGQLAFFIVVMGASVWGLSLMGVWGLVAINAFFVVLVSFGLTFVARPKLFRPLFRLLPSQVEARIQTLIAAVSAYHGKGRTLAMAVLHGVAVHAFNNLIYTCAAQAMQLPVTPTVVFFASSLVIMSTIVPLSFNGVGVREATAAGVLSSIGGVSPAVAAATYTLGWIAEMLISAFGILFFMARRDGYDGELIVEDAEREKAIVAELPEVPEANWPKRLRGLSLGAGAGLLAGAIVGVVEGAVVVADGGGRVGYGVMPYGAVAYGLFCAIGGAFFGLASAWLGRWMRREAVPEPQAYARLTALMVAALGCALTAFRIRRDIFHEEFPWKSKEGLLLLLGCAVGALAIYLALAFVLRVWTGKRFGSFMLRAWGSPALVAGIVLGLSGLTLFAGSSASAHGNATRGTAPEGAPNVLFVVVDTLRADHLPAYGYADGRTPSLDRFAQDAVRYDFAFANASWTRPSFASILTGRHVSSHGVMDKDSALPDPVTTLPEALYAGGYATAGVITNFNIGPAYNFQQGFDTYEFLEPNLVLGADDSARKLLLVEAMRKGIEKVREMGGRVEPGSAYQDAETVNRHVVSWLDAAPADLPFFLFVGYMDPHDPYYPHPYDGTAYSRAAHHSPDLDEAAHLRELYDGEITYWDEHFGHLMDDLRRRGLYDDMMIVVTADHGEEFGDHGGFWHGTTLYDELVHVPLFVKLPGNERAGTHVSHWVQSVDLMPSILRRVGLPIPDGVQGGSIQEGSTRVYAEESHEGNILESVRERRDFEELKLITANEGNPRGLAPVELYRVADDPTEQHNVAETQHDQVQALMRTMETEREAASVGAVEHERVRRLDHDEICNLCTLGYSDVEQCCRDGCLSGAACDGH